MWLAPRLIAASRLPLGFQGIRGILDINGILRAGLDWQRWTMQ
jgi:hypothetical protein